MKDIKSILVGVMLLVVSLSEGHHYAHPTCDANAKCVGYYEGFNCSCNSGYKGSDFGCVNIDECTETPEVCTEIETCNDIIGSYNCTCGHIDIICHEKAVCAIDSHNATSCVCIEGYTGNGTFCEDIDECLEGSDNCSADAHCRNTEGSYTCTCCKGYEGDGFTCIDIDECERKTFDCDEYLTCNNTKGSYVCVCGDDGFCDKNGYCTEHENITSCFCNSGYTGTGTECHDIDECKLPDYPCHEKAKCINTNGAFRCVCEDPYKGNGIHECSSAQTFAMSTSSILLPVSTWLLMLFR